MKPDTALRLVGQYARLTREIKLCKKQIGEALDGCRGLNGWRLETETNPGWEPTPTDRAQTDQDTHLSVWYGKDYGEYEDHGYPKFVRFTVGDGDEPIECPACYAAHLVVQRRKELRKKLAAVKGAMTRLGA